VSGIYKELLRLEEKKKQKSWHTVGIPEEKLVAAGTVQNSGNRWESGAEGGI